MVASVTLRVRPERAGEEAAIRETVRAAFAATEEVDGTVEADTVDALRREPEFDPSLSFVAELDGRIIGHLVFTPCRVRSEEGETAALALAPLSVLRGYEHTFAGTRLMRHGLAACREAGHGIVIVLGHAKYYRRFGFRPASQFGIEPPWAVHDDYFQALALRPGALDGVHGVVEYLPPLDLRADQSS